MDKFSSSNAKEQGNLNNLCYWAKPRNSKSRLCRFFTDYIPDVQLSNRLSVWEVDQQSIGLLKRVENKVKLIVGKTQSYLHRIWHGHETGQILQESTVFFKPNTLHAIVENLGRLGQCLIRGDRIVIVGGPGNS
jgi:hypothetical protein